MMHRSARRLCEVSPGLTLSTSANLHSPTANSVALRLYAFLLRQLDYAACLPTSVRPSSVRRLSLESSTVAERARDASCLCLASTVQYLESSLSLLVTSDSDLPIRIIIKLCSVLLAYPATDDDCCHQHA